MSVDHASSVHRTRERDFNQFFSTPHTYLILSGIGLGISLVDPGVSIPRPCSLRTAGSMRSEKSFRPLRENSCLLAGLNSNKHSYLCLV